MSLTGVYILLAISIVIGIAAVVLCVLVLKRHGNNGGSDISLAELRDETRYIEDTVDKTVRISESMIVGAINAQNAAQNENARQLYERFDRFMLSTDAKLDKMREDTAYSLNEVKNANAASLKEVRDDNARNLAQMKADNAAQLEKMRETVDEKLSSTLEQRFDRSFKLVNDRLEEIHRTFGELQSLQTGVNDLNKIFKNVKTRGTWGEVALESLLAQILTPEQYDKQVRLTRGSEDMVDFVIKMPGKGDGEVLLPIDSKFPMEDYARLAEAADRADVDEIEAASKALAAKVKAEAMSIRDKYIKPPKTTDFAIMYLPTEGLYAEIIKREGLVEDIQNKYRIVVCGPTTIAALLNSLQMGFKSVAIEKRSTEIGKLLTSFIADFAKFSKLLQQTGDKLSGVQTTLMNAEKRTEYIRQKLDKVSRITGEEAPLLPDGEEVAFDTVEEC
ncbi:MAG: DNA recombination protein RmuC [Clostridia bacterium]|nr:DNA recombination protein RmuC [Clostridia bacterium]